MTAAETIRVARARAAARAREAISLRWHLHEPMPVCRECGPYALAWRGRRRAVRP